MRRMTSVTRLPMTIALVLLAAWSGVVHAQGGKTASASADETAILDRINKACAAFEKGDVPYLLDFLDETFTLTDSRGQVTTRDQNVAEIKAREPRYEVFRNHDMKVRVYGDSAVVTGITTIKGTVGGQPFAVDVQFTDTLIKRAGKWHMVASHASSLAKK
jgi:ketosteroid isomerase-like protein